MLKVVVGLKECITGKELDEDTANAPDIARIAPSQVQYDLWCSIMSCRNDRGMVFVIEGGRPEINQPDLRIKQDSPLSGNTLHSGGRRGYVAVVCEGLV